MTGLLQLAPNLTGLDISEGWCLSWYSAWVCQGLLQVRSQPWWLVFFFLGSLLALLVAVLLLYRVKRQITQQRRAIREALGGFAGITDPMSFVSFAEQLPYGLAMLGEDGEIIYCNEGFASLHGYETAELNGILFANLIADTEQDYAAYIKQALASEIGSFSDEAWHKRQDSTLIPLMISIGKVSRTESQPAYTTVTAVDISKRKTIDAALKESEERFRTLAENIPGTVYLCNYDKRWSMIYLNDEVEWLTGYRKEQFLNDEVSFADLYHPDDVDHVYATVEAALANREPFRLVYRIKHPASVYRWVEEVGTAILRNGEVVYLEGFLLDITERKQAEQRLSNLNLELNQANEALRTKNRELSELVTELNRTNADYMSMNRQLTLSRLELETGREQLVTSREQYRRLVELAREGILSVDANELITFANPFMAALLGYEPEQLVGKPLTEFCDSETQQRLLAETDLRRTGLNSTYEGRFLHKDGATRDILVSASPLFDATGQFEGAFAVLTDLTEVNRLNQVLLSQQKEESVVTLAGGVAHDFNNILVGVLGSASILSGYLDENQEAQDLCELITISAERLQELTGQLLAYARGGRYDPQSLDLNNTITKSEPILRNLLHDKISIELQLSDNLPKVSVDPGQIAQVIMNLVMNAGEAMPAGGQLRINTSCYQHEQDSAPPQLAQLASGEFVKLTISDTGKGIEDSVLERIFDPFFSTKSQGRGLGLAAAKGIITNHKGMIWVDSVPGQGTTFQLLLPANVEQLTPAATVPSILLIDDEELVLTITQKILKRADCKVLTARGGHAGWETFLKHEEEIGTILLDLEMAEMDGQELCVRIRERKPEIRLLAASGWGQTANSKNVGNCKIDGFVGKPYRLEELRKWLSPAD